MPIEPPNPHRIYATLRDVLAQLQALADANPRDSRPTEAMGGVEIAIRAMDSYETEKQAPSA